MSIRLMIVIGVYRRYNSSTKSKNHPRAKKHWYVFYYDDFFVLHTKRISFFMVPYYKIQVKKRRVFVCLDCNTKFLALIKKGTKFVPCINGCDSENS